MVRLYRIVRLEKKLKEDMRDRILYGMMRLNRLDILVRVFRIDMMVIRTGWIGL